MLKTSKVMLFIVLGVVFWLTGLLMVRFGGDLFFAADSPWRIVIYILSFPLLWVALWIASTVSRTPMNELLEPVTIMTFAAIFLDGLVIGFLPQAYGDDPGHVMRGAAWILWGGGVGLFLAWFLSRRTPAK